MKADHLFEYQKYTGTKIRTQRTTIVKYKLYLYPIWSLENQISIHFQAGEN